LKGRFRQALAAMLVAAFFMGGCFTFSARVPGTVRGDVDEEAVVVGQFDRSFTRWYFLWGLVGIGDEEIIARELKAAAQAKNADGVANLIYESEFSCWDYGIGQITCGLLSPRTYRLRGDLVKIEGPPPSAPGRSGDQGASDHKGDGHAH
jgi:hypothetical protein